MTAPTTRRALLRLAGAAGVAALLSPRTAHAADRVSVTVELEQPKLQVGEGVEFTVQVEVEGDGGGDVPEPVLPDLAAMGLGLAGPPSTFRSTSSSFSFGTGRGSTVTSRTTQTYVYTLLPSKPGRFELPVHVMSGKTKIAAPRIPVLEVTGEAAPQEPVVPGADAGPTQPQGDLFLWTRIDKPSLYVGEQLTYALEVYERLPFPNIQLRQLPGFQDFWSEQLPEAGMRQESVAGTMYRVHPGLRRALFPQRAGQLTISPAEVGVGMRRRVTGRPAVVDVKPLPAGAPAGFSPNNVGRYTIAAAVDRKTFKAGEPFTLTITIRGTGNIRVIDPGDWPELPGLRRYDPKVETQVTVGAQVGGVRTYAFLVIPERGGKLTIPAHRFAFFDPAADAYQTAQTAPIELAVEGDPGAPEPTGSEPQAAAQAPTEAAEQEGILAPIVGLPALPRAAASDSWLTFERWTWGMVAVPAALSLGTVGRALWRRFGPDDASRAAAARAARQRALLANAEAGVATGDGFYNALAALLQSAAVERAGPDGEGLPRGNLLQLLKDRGVPPADCDRLRALLDRCDAARFGASAETAVDREAALKTARDLLRAPSLAPKV